MEQPKTPATTDQSFQPPDASFPASLQEIVCKVKTASQQCHDDPQQLLELLRTLEKLHREIRVNLFEPSLPNTRNDLHEVLLDIEENGGWPYIERMKIRFFLQNIFTNVDNSQDSE
jgi:hypothetical protein